MKRFWIGWIAALVAATAFACPQPAAAQDTITGYETKCGPDAAEFDTFTVTDDTKPDGTPYHDPSGAYPGESVRIFSCKTAGHYVRMNFMYFVTQLECGAEASGWISAWVDGRKVLDKASWNDYGACATAMAGHQPAHTLTRIIFNDRRHLTTCYTDFTYDAQQGDAVGKNACQLQDLSGLEPDLKSVFYGPVKLTPDRLLLTVGNPAFCSPITQVLNGPHPASGDLPPLPELSPLTKPSDDQSAKGWTQTFIADIDNDGIADAVTYNGVDRDPGAAYMHDFTWRSSATGADRSVRAGWPEGDDFLNVDATAVFRFVRIDGQIYIFQVNDDIGQVGGVEMQPSPDVPLYADSHLIALHPDGRETEVCAWKPQIHPEEAL